MKYDYRERINLSLLPSQTRLWNETYKLAFSPTSPNAPTQERSHVTRADLLISLFEALISALNSVNFFLSVLSSFNAL